MYITTKLLGANESISKLSDCMEISEKPFTRYYGEAHIPVMTDTFDSG